MQKKTRWMLSHTCPHCRLHYEEFVGRNPSDPVIKEVRYRDDGSRVTETFGDNILLTSTCTADGGCRMQYQATVVIRPDPYQGGRAVVAAVEFGE